MTTSKNESFGVSYNIVKIIFIPIVLLNLYSWIFEELSPQPSCPILKSACRVSPLHSVQDLISA